VHGQYPGSYDDIVNDGMLQLTAPSLSHRLTVSCCPSVTRPYCVNRFYQTHGRYPGSYDDTVDDDIPQLKNMASHVLAEVGASGAAVQDDIVGEMCRWGHMVGVGGEVEGDREHRWWGVGGSGCGWGTSTTWHRWGDVQVSAYAVVQGCAGSETAG
jgi:hypothetical protein